MNSRVCYFFLLNILGFFSILPIEKTAAQCAPTAIEIPNNGIDEDCDNLDDIFLHLPPYIYMVEGKNFELYFRNTILSTHPNDYVFEVVSALNGTNASGKWSFTPSFSNVGEHAFTLRVKAPNGQVLASAASTVRIAPANSPTTQQQDIIMLGHSFINQGYTPHYFRLLTTETGNPPMTLHGKQYNWVDGISSHEAIGGASWKFFKNDVSSPIRYFGQMNFTAYFNDVMGFGNRPDILILHLDVNDYNFTGSLTGNTMQEIEDYIQDDYVQHIEPMMSQLRSAAPNTKIAICYTPPCNSRQGAFTGHFGAQSILADRYRWKKITHAIYKKYDEYFRGRESENIYMLPIHLDVDDVNEFDLSDPVHPWKIGQSLSEPSGYREIAKSKYAFVKYLWNLGVNGQCLLTAGASNITCNNNGTPVVVTDDTYTFDLGVNAINGNGSWRTTINGQTITGTYGSTRNLGPFPIANGPMTFTVSDQSNAACQSVVTVSPPASCSNGSGSTIDLKLNMTSSPAAPAVYTNFSVTVTVENTAPLAASNVKVQVVKPNNANYQAGNAFSASQGDFRWYSDRVWDVGNLPPLGSATLTVNYFLLTPNPLPMYAQVTDASPTDSDSAPNNGNGSTAVEDDEFVLTINGGGGNPCALTSSVNAVQCDNNGTATNPSDDRYAFNLVVNGTNAGSGWTATINGVNQTGQYGVAKALGPYAISGGTLNFTIRDAQTNTCTVSQAVTPPATCSNGGGGNETDLSLQMTSGTTSAPIYSNFTSTLTLRNTSSTAASDVVVQLTNPSGSTYQGGSEGGTANGSFEWWNNRWNIGTLAAGQTATLTVNYFTLSAASMTFYAQVINASPSDTDSSPNNGTPPNANEDDEAAFTLNGGGGTPTCTINATAGNVRCNNNGTSSTTTDDTYSFDLTVSGSGNGWTTSIAGQNYSGSYGQTVSIGSLPISAGAVNFTVRDQSNANCTTAETVDAPAPCSTPSSANCSSTSAYPWHEWISRVQIGTFIQNSGKAPYTDYSASPINLQTGVANSLLCRATFSWETHDEYWKIWIDYDQDGIFEEPNELAFSGVMTAPAATPNATKSINGNFTIPLGAALGTAKMRVSMKRGSFPDPCETLPQGEVEDYAVNITAQIISPLVSSSEAEFGLLYFEAKERFGEAYLDWAAQSDVEKFEVERSTDGQFFEKINTVQKSLDGGAAAYNYVDAEAEKGINYYRLKLFDQNGKTAYSQVQMLDIQPLESLLIFPNPTIDRAKIWLKPYLEQNIAVRIIDNLGNVVEQFSAENLQQEVYEIQADILPSGVYQIVLQVEGQRAMHARLVVQE